MKEWEKAKKKRRKENSRSRIGRKQKKHADKLKSHSNTNEKDKSHTTKNVLEVRRGENRSIKTEKRRKKSGKK